MPDPKVERQLGQLLVDRRLLTVDDLEDGLVTAARNGTSFGSHLVTTGRVLAKDLLATVAGRLGLAFEDVTEALPDPRALVLLDPQTAASNEALPIRIDEAGRLEVVVPDPLNDAKAGALRVAADREVQFLLGHRPALTAAIDRAYRGLKLRTPPT